MFWKKIDSKKYSFFLSEGLIQLKNIRSKEILANSFKKNIHFFLKTDVLDRATIDLIDCAVYQDEKVKNHSQCVVTSCNQCIKLFFHTISSCEFIAFSVFGGKTPDVQ